MCEALAVRKGAALTAVVIDNAGLSERGAVEEDVAGGVVGEGEGRSRPRVGPVLHGAVLRADVAWRDQPVW